MKRNVLACINPLSNTEDSMAARTSIYLADETRAMARPGDSLSGRINQLAGRYAEIIRRDTRNTLKLFTPEEQRAILSACWSWMMEPAATIPGGIAADVEDSSPDEIGLADEAEQDALLAKLAALTTGQQMCLAEWIEGERNKAGAASSDPEDA